MKQTHGKATRAEGSGNADVQMLAGFSKVAPNVYGVLLGKAAIMGRRLSVSWREDGSMLAVLSAEMPDDGSTVVAFGQGFRFEEAIRNLNGAIAKGDWHVDKFPGNGGCRPTGPARGGGKVDGDGYMQAELPNMGTGGA